MPRQGGDFGRDHRRTEDGRLRSWVAPQVQTFARAQYILKLDLFDLLDRYPILKEQRHSSGGKRKSIVARAEEIMRHDAPISINKAVAQAEQEEERDVEELKEG